VTDDTAAINKAIQDGNRCGKGCDSSTVTPALVYFPAGTYIVSQPIVAMYYSQLVGDPTNRPHIKGSATFSGIALIDSDPYNSDGTNWYTNQNNFFRAIRNMVIDTTALPAASGTCIHWQVAQATSLINIRCEMSQAPGNSHQGVFMDNGSGGFMSDLEFVGGKYGVFLGNQQFMTRNLKFSNCQTAIFVNWDWQWTFKSVQINGCQVGIDISTLDKNGSQTVGSVVLLESTISNTPIGLKTARTGNFSRPVSGGSAVLDNVQLIDVPKAVVGSDNSTILAGGSLTIDLWGQGRSYKPDGSVVTIQGNMARPFSKPYALLDSTGKIFEKSRPQYTDIPASKFISVRSHGAKGDGTTDDTAALKQIFAQYGGDVSRVIYFDHGVYIVSSTIEIPVNTRIVGEAWAVVMAYGSAFQDPNNPVPVWQVGKVGEVGTVEMSEIIFQVKGPNTGAILLQWNSRDPNGQQGANGMWDVHFRVAGTAGTNLEPAQCLKNPNATVTPDPRCEAAFMHLHIGTTASLYVENSWAWTADHGLDGDFDQITVYNARGIYDESAQGPVWLYGTAAEHNVLYQYQFANTKNVFVGMMQTETPYFQANPAANVPFPSLPTWHDPDYSKCVTESCKKSWAMRIINTSEFLIYGAGFYSFFENYNQGRLSPLFFTCESMLMNIDCVKSMSCQDSIVDVQGSPQLSIYNLNTVASASMLDLNGNKIIKAQDNVDTFAQTVMEFST
jgi:glucan 1,3-beta-glucosidase